MLLTHLELVEDRRLRRHFDGAMELLRRRDEGPLSKAQRRRRARLVRALAEYRERGLFPRNDRFRRRTPFFVDSVGTRCAMAHLIELSGHAGIVERVASSRNNAFVRELAGEELDDWLAGHGLTLAEAARIQPTYDPRAELRAECEHGSGRPTIAPNAVLLRATIVSQHQARVTSLLGSPTQVEVGQVIDLGVGTDRRSRSIDPLSGFFAVGDDVLLQPFVNQTEDGEQVSNWRPRQWLKIKGDQLGGVAVDQYVAMLRSPDCVEQLAALYEAKHPRQPGLEGHVLPREDTGASEQSCHGCAIPPSPFATPTELAYIAGALVLAWRRRRPTSQR